MRRPATRQRANCRCQEREKPPDWGGGFRTRVGRGGGCVRCGCRRDRPQGDAFRVCPRRPRVVTSTRSITLIRCGDASWVGAFATASGVGDPLMVAVDRDALPRSAASVSAAGGRSRCSVVLASVSSIPTTVVVDRFLRFGISDNTEACLRAESGLSLGEAAVGKAPAGLSSERGRVVPPPTGSGSRSCGHDGLLLSLRSGSAVSGEGPALTASSSPASSQRAGRRCPAWCRCLRRT